MYGPLDSTITSGLINLRGKRTIGALATKLSRKTGLALLTERNFICRLEAGEITSTSIHHVREQISQSNLEKLAAYLRVLEVKPEDPLIEKIKNYSRNFEYPISFSRRPRRQYALK